jgi:hypothetical protein
MSYHQTSVDVVTLHSRDDWFAECKASIPAECNHIITKVDRPAKLGAEYAKAFSLASAPFVTWVDDDDMMEHAALGPCLQVLEDPTVAAVWTNYVKIDSEGCLLSRHTHEGVIFSVDNMLVDYVHVHQLVVARTELVKRTLPFVSRAVGRGSLTAMVCMLAEFGQILPVPVFGYRWRQHNDNHHSVHQEDNRVDLVREFQEFYRDRIENGRPVVD